jgi:hypothetical protein
LIVWCGDAPCPLSIRNRQRQENFVVRAWPFPTNSSKVKEKWA